MNGVSRGGRAGHLAWFIRSSRRWDSYGYVIGNGNVGFRLNGVRRGGVYNDYARYCKSVYRNSYAKANGHREIGFRFEWCI